VPRKGFIFTMLRLVGTCRLCTYSANFFTWMGATAISGERRSRLYRLTRNRRAKRSLIISSVGMRPRTMRISLPKSNARTSPPGCAAVVVSTFPESTPWIRASISAWSSTLSSLTARPSSLHHEAGEVDRLHLVGLAAGGLDHVADGRERIGAQMLLAVASAELARFLIAEQQQQVVAHGRVVCLEQLHGRRI